MGQIFRRINRIAKSYLDDKPSNTGIDPSLLNPDYELRRQFEDLNRSQKNSGSKSNFDSGKKQSNPASNQQFNLQLACSILQVKQNSSIEEIKEAYKKRMKEYHPDRVASLGAELKELAEKKSKDINEAYNFLKKIKVFD